MEAVHHEAAHQAEPLSPRPWVVAIAVAAALLVLLGGGIATLRGPRAIDLAKVSIPATVEPSANSISATPPTKFRWQPGTPGAMTQVVIHKGNFEVLWTSPPLRGVSEIDVPLQIYEGQGAGAPLYWRVRELERGHALGSSDYAPFFFRVDSRGYGPGEAPVLFDYVE